MRALPYPDASFDLVVSITVLCFIEDEIQVARELVRAARRRVAIGLLNRHSMLWLEKGRGGGRGAYRRAKWHTVREARNLFCSQTAQHVRVRTAIQLPGGGRWARAVEHAWPSTWCLGAFLLVVADVAGPRVRQST